MDLDINEYEIIKSALEQDITHQKKQIEDPNFGEDIRFEMWLIETQELHKKVSNHLMELKAIN